MLPCVVLEEGNVEVIMAEYLKIDPECKYDGGSNLTRAECLALRVIDCFPGSSLSRTRDVIQIDIEGDEGCVLLVAAEALEVRLPTVEWTQGAYGPRETSRFWKRIRTEHLRHERLVELRTIDISKGGSRFAHYGHIESGAAPVFKQLAQEKNLAGLDPDQFSD
jgi:hypothetical protein